MKVHVFLDLYLVVLLKKYIGRHLVLINHKLKAETNVNMDSVSKYSCCQIQNFLQINNSKKMFLVLIDYFPF